MLTLVIRNALAERIAKIAAVKTKFAKGLIWAIFNRSCFEQLLVDMHQTCLIYKWYWWLALNDLNRNFVEAINPPRLATALSSSVSDLETKQNELSNLYTKGVIQGYTQKPLSGKPNVYDWMVLIKWYLIQTNEVVVVVVVIFANLFLNFCDDSQFNLEGWRWYPRPLQSDLYQDWPSGVSASVLVGQSPEHDILPCWCLDNGMKCNSAQTSQHLCFPPLPGPLLRRQSCPPPRARQRRKRRPKLSPRNDLSQKQRRNKAAHLSLRDRESDWVGWYFLSVFTPRVC